MAIASSCGGSGLTSGQHRSCSVDLLAYYNAYMALVTGHQTVRIRTADNREIQTTPANINDVLKMYVFLYAECGEGSGLPDLSGLDGTSLIKRGAPARVGGVRRLC